MQTEELLIVEPRFERGNTDRPILYLSQMFNDNKLLKPEFQRSESVWDEAKKRQWMESILNHQAIGVIVTYQLNGSGPIFLADGLQRITATREFMNNPSNFGFEFGSEQATAYCMAFAIPVQHRHYKTHREAMYAFQNLNKGTALTPYEFHKGELVLNSTAGKIVHEKIPRIVDAITMPYLTARKYNRNTQSRLIRDNYALFYQYVSGYKGLSFWKVGHLQDTGKSIEHHVREYIDENRFSINKLNKMMEDFRRFLASEVSFLDTVISETGQKGKAFSPAALRNLLHTAIWRKNTGAPRKHFESFIRALMEIWKPFGSFTAKIDIPDSEPIRSASFATDNIFQTRDLCDAMKIPLFKLSRRRSMKKATIGNDVSHVKPFSLCGDGDVIIEPSGVNRARGAAEIAL